MSNLKELAGAIRNRFGDNHHENLSPNGRLPNERAKIEFLEKEIENLITRLQPYSEIKGPGFVKLRISQQEVNSCLPKEPKPLSNWLRNPFVISPNYGLTITVQAGNLREGAKECSITIGIESLPSDPEKSLEKQFTGSGVTAKLYKNFAFCGAVTFIEESKYINPALLKKARDLDTKLAVAALIDFGNRLVDAKEFKLEQAIEPFPSTPALA